MVRRAISSTRVHYYYYCYYYYYYYDCYYCYYYDDDFTMSSTRVRAFHPPASSMHALRQTPPVPLKLKKLPVLKRAYCSHLMCALRQISWYLR